ncbi:hypothetical protein ACFPIJ_56835 [Dactylosporangium cerinum]|uniref:Uncharacterized protein n=1 Tax=Dactylosporangium cerinum TaxID=1434730 RepID=A0ABV9WFW7_9ACTN
MKLLFEASAPVHAPLAQVRRLIDSEWVLETVVGAAGRAYVDIDHRDGVVGFQGHWWYRGEISASTSGSHTMITYRVFNMARRGAWAVPLANRLFIGYKSAVRDTATRLARAVESHLAQAA